jgi:hypothetical protein
MSVSSEQFRGKYCMLNPKLGDYEDISTSSEIKKGFGMKKKFKFRYETYQHVVVGVMPGVVKLLYSMFKLAEVLHSAAAAAGVVYHLTVLANA